METIMDYNDTDPEAIMSLDSLNLSYNNTSADFEAKKNHTVLVASLMFASGVIGNLLALFVLATSAIEQRRTLFYKLVAGLAVTDLFGTCATSPVVIAVYVNNFKFIGGKMMCDYFSFMMILAGFTTMFIVCAMAVERYICVRHPYVYHTRLTAMYAKITILGSWVLSILIALLPIVGLGSNTFQYPGTWCFFNYESREPRDVAFNILYATIALLTIAVTVGCNAAVIYTLMKMRMQQSLLKSKNGAGRKYRCSSKRYAEIQMVVLLIGITIVFSTCFAPLMVYVLLCQTEFVHQFDTKQAGLLMVRFASFNPILDPFVYILFRRELVWKVVYTIKCILRIHSSPQTQVATPPVLTYDAEDDSCADFCWHCLCEPPSKRTSLMWSSKGANSAYYRSPSYLRRASELSMGNGTASPRAIITPPSPADQFVLKKFTPKGQQTPV